MLHRTIFIGLGSTGCNTIDALQDIAYLSTGDAAMGGAWAYLKLDTENPADHTFCGSVAKEIHIEVDVPEHANLATHLKKMANDPAQDMNDLSWLWDQGKVLIPAQKAGSGLNRRYARGCIYYYWNVDNSKQKSIKSWLIDTMGEFIAADDPRSPDKIEAKLDRLLPPGVIRPKVSRVASNPVHFVIIATLSGGTGSGALLELAKWIYKEGIFTGNITCLGYPASTIHPDGGTSGSNNRRYNSIESLYYYEAFLRDSKGPGNLRPMFVVSPSNDNINLDPKDGIAVEQLEYLGAMFLSRMSAAMDWDAIVVDLNNMFGSDLHPWSFSMSGVRIPALEIKAQRIFEAVEKICDPKNSQELINWSHQPVIAEKTISQYAKQMLSACFKHIEEEVGHRFDALPKIRKQNFDVELKNNHLDWFGDDKSGLAGALVTDLVEMIVVGLKEQMLSKPGLRSLVYMELLLKQAKTESAGVPTFKRADLEKAYGMLHGDPPTHVGRRRLFTWYMKHAFIQAVDELQKKVELLKDALQRVTVSQELKNVIQTRLDARIYKKVTPANFEIPLPQLSFLDMDSVFTSMKNRNDKMDAGKLKKEILSELSVKTQIPQSSSFDRGWFSAEDAVGYMKSFLDGPMIELKDTVGVDLILNGCFGGALTEMIKNNQIDQIKAFETRITELGVNVQKKRLDMDLTSLMSPLQIDAIKIWKHISREKLKIGDRQYQREIEEVSLPERRGDYYPLNLNSNIDIDVFKAILICSCLDRKGPGCLYVTGVDPLYSPTRFSNANREYGISIPDPSGTELFLSMPISGDINEMVGLISVLASKHSNSLSSWIAVINNRKSGDTGLQAKMDRLFALGPFVISLGSRTVQIFRNNF